MRSGALRLGEMKPSVIRDMTRLAMEAGAINMAQGFPEFDPPPPVVAAAQRALSEGSNQYSITWGSQLLREAIGAKYGRFYQMALDPQLEITVTCGVTEAVIAALMGLVDPGDRVVVLEPAHENYFPGIRWAGGEPIWVSMRPPDFRWDPAEMRAAFAQRPRVIILNSPQNPSGRVLEEAELSQIAALCREFDVIAITDEIYEHMLYDGRRHIPLATLPGMAARTVTISGLSKSYAATGWRIGWIVAPAPLAAAIRTVHDFLTICAPTPLQEGAAVAVASDDAFYDELVATYTRARDATMQILAEAGFRARTPEGAYYVLADFSQLQPELDDVAFTRWLIAERGVAVVPASSFYHDPTLGHRHVRFAFPKRPETLAEVGRRLRRG